MKIQKATSPPQDVSVDSAHTDIQEALTIMNEEEKAPWPDLKACPASLNSVFALTQAGLSLDTASAIHQAYNTIPHPCLCLEIYAINCIAPLASQIDVGMIEDDWTSVLVQLGANDQLIHAIVQPDMEDVMLCNTAWGWVMEAMDTRWKFYEGMIKLGRVKEMSGRGPGEQCEGEDAP